MPTQSLSWFPGSLLYFDREPDAEVRCKSRLEPGLTSEVNTRIDKKTMGLWSVSFTVIVNTIKPKTKHECSRTWVWKERVTFMGTQGQDSVLSLSVLYESIPNACWFLWTSIQVVLVFLCWSPQKSCDRYSMPQKKINTELSKQMYCLLVKF